MIYDPDSALPCCILSDQGGDPLETQLAIQMNYANIYMRLIHRIYHLTGLAFHDPTQA